MTNVDGAISIAGVPWIGQDEFYNSDVQWSIYRYADSKWTKTSLGLESSRWQSQGVLREIDGSAWSMQFDQAKIPGGYAGQILVRRAEPDGSVAHTVGKPLVAPQRLSPPIVLDLREHMGSVYALYNAPTRSGAPRLELARIALGDR